MAENTVVCIASYFKGYDFIDELHKLGNKVILISSDNIKHKEWPWHAIDEVFYMNEIEPSVWDLNHLVQGFSHLMVSRKVDALVALDDFDVEKAAMVRETFRIPGMGQTTHRYFRDKLAMRQMAKDSGIDVPEFSSIFNDAVVEEFTQKVPAPWVLKPRSEASATGIVKVNSIEELRESINKTGSERYRYLLESFKPGDVFHVDSLVYNREIVFTSASQYLSPPMQVSHDGGVFRTKTLSQSSEEYNALKAANTKVLKSFGLVNGATHTEFIRGNTDGKWYFLETSSRVGGAHISDLVEASSGINLWREWARIENSLLNHTKYQLPTPTEEFSGLIIALINEQNVRQEEFECEEILKFLPLDHHAAIIYKSDSSEKIQQRLDEAAEIITGKYLNILPPKGKPRS